MSEQMSFQGVTASKMRGSDGRPAGADHSFFPPEQFSSNSPLCLARWRQ
jgi:hypothetical protein